MNNTKVLLITPPLTQLNTPYPATAYLSGFLNGQDIKTTQADLGIELVSELFSKKGLKNIFAEIKNSNYKLSENSNRILALKNNYLQSITDVIDFLRGKNESLMHRICSRNFLPEASRFNQINDVEYAFGNMGIRDKARYFATLYIEDIGDFIRDTISPKFEFTRYAEHLGMSAHTFNDLEEQLQTEPDYVDKIMLYLLAIKIEETKPDIIGFSIPFPGNLFGALRCGQYIKKFHPEIKIVFGGGYPSTELRDLSDIRVFDYTDFIVLDDGEIPLLQIIHFMDNKISLNELKRTFIINNKKVKYINNPFVKDIAHENTGNPDYTDLPLDTYLSVIEVTNPMHRLWTDGRWNKLTLAHGCYWHRCTFCDTSLDYVGRFEPAKAKTIVDKIEKIIRQTGESSFHFTDEAAPPNLLAEVSLELLRRKINITWWTNIRFEAGFTPDLAKLIAASGCIAVAGGLEVASDRLLKLINKGVSLKQVSKTTRNLVNEGIMIHAYLMYGFPTQTAQETIDALEVVRQLFFHALIQSAYWHLFTVTVHSPVGKNPEKFKITIPKGQHGSFANNDLQHIDTANNHEKFGNGLRKALYNYMNDIGFDFHLQEWFDFPVPETSVDEYLIDNYLDLPDKPDYEKLNYRLYYIGNDFIVKNNKRKMQLVFHTKNTIIKIKDTTEVINSISKLLINLSDFKSIKLLDFSRDFEKQTGFSFMIFLQTDSWQKLKDAGLVLIK
ncbi:MAG: radical SAM protein [Bacteroidales bacterium]|nr:radical SAM protein [Bacteroidales bacterium]